MTQKRFLDHFGLIRLVKASMGSQAEMQRMERGPTSHTKATFSGMTAFIGVLSLLITIISVATPHWGSYSPIGQSFYSAGKVSFNLLLGSKALFWEELTSADKDKTKLFVSRSLMWLLWELLYTMIYILWLLKLSQFLSIFNSFTKLCA